MGIGVGVVGIGWIAEKIYLPYLLNAKFIDKVMIYDIDDKKTELITKKSSETKLSCTKELNKDIFLNNIIDVVIILTPNYMHFDLIKRSIENNKKVFCEKPLCINNEELNQLVKIIDKKKGYLLPLLSSRYRKEIELLKKQIELEQVGVIKNIKMGWIRNKGLPGQEWFLNKELSGGGVLIDLGSHILDILSYIFELKNPTNIISTIKNFSEGNNESVANWHGEKSSLKNFTMNVEDNVTLSMHFNNISCAIDLAWASANKYDQTFIEVNGSRGTMRLNTLFGFSENTDLERAILDVNTSVNKKKYYFDLNDKLYPHFKMLDYYFKKLLGDNQLQEKLCMNSIDNLRLINKIYKNSEIV